MPHSSSLAGSTDKPARRKRHWLTVPVLFVVVAATALFAYFQFFAAPGSWHTVVASVGEGVQSHGFWMAVAVGLGAQVVDGALGMAYGVTSTTFLLSIGVPPATASASVHVAEIFTTGFSGFSHFKLGNVNKALFKRLVVPGVIGGLVGAYVLTSFDAKAIKPFISAYLLLIGLYILSKVWRKLRVRTDPPRYVVPLALTGGFADAVGGGGWGPVVTTSLIGGGHDPRTTIGSVNAAEFFIALGTGLSFTLLGSLTEWTVIAGLILGGLFAAPFAAVLTRYAPPKVLLGIVGLLISALSAWNLYKLF